MKKEEYPTKAQLWEELVKMIDQNIDNAWKAGYYAGKNEAVETEIVIEDLDK